MLEIPAMAVIGGILGLLMVVATTLIKVSYTRVEETLKRVDATIHQLEQHKIVHEEWRKGADHERCELRRRVSVLEKKAFGHAREDNTPPTAG